MTSRTFRLFVSSTFSDFTEERKLLQNIVFPKIKEYCLAKQLVFQPIDLRWGVTNEASNDQKTLELCLEEVQAAKYHPYPNFLIMIGDRYGTVILPYLIEEKEFDKIFEFIEDEDDKKLLHTWYKLDKNQLPASYIIQERKSSQESHDGIDYTNRKNWKPINNKLLKMLQDVVKKTDINESEKKKYFTSATEAEVIEGIFKYLDKTPFQKKYLEEDKTIEKIDSNNVHAYIRNIKSTDNIKLEDNFSDDKHQEVKSVKDEINEVLNENNIYEINVDLTDVKKDEYDKLSYYYKELNDTDISFVSKILKYLEQSIDLFLENIENITPPELEKLEQERFKDDKLKLFLCRKKPLEEIKKYVNSGINKPFIIYGRSGLGKSALMAKSIDNTIKAKTQDKVIYRFVGSTTTLNDSPSLLISILQDLGIKEEIKKITNLQTGNEENEKIEKFYLRIHEHFINTKEEKIIFIDAIDQVSNEDEFIWLPKELPKNLKIIISALNDKSYNDTQYFEKLKTKTNNLYALEPFEDPKSLICSKLKGYRRTITNEQLKYVLSQEDSNSPLYITVAVEELRHWTHNSIEKLATSQKEIISEYISNLHTKFHHDKELIKRVFSYIYLTDGLSESELLEIINTDKEFVKQIAPDIHHKKETDKLPIVIWARLHYQIKEFLKLEDKEGQNTMKFFHREFNSVFNLESDKNKDGFFVKNELKNIHENLISLILKHIENDDRRWEKLYKSLAVFHNLTYEDNETLQYFAYSYADKRDLNNLYFLFENKDYINRYEKVSQGRFRVFYAKYFHENAKLEHEIISGRNIYKVSLTSLSQALKSIGSIKEAKEYDDYVYTLEKKLLRKGKPKDFVLSANESAASMIRNGDNKGAIERLEEARPYGEELIKSGNYKAIEFNATLLSNLAEAYKREDESNLLKSINLLEEASELTRGDKGEGLEIHIKILNKLAIYYGNDGYDYNKALENANKALSIGFIFLAMGKKFLLDSLLETHDILGFLYLEIPEEALVKEKDKHNVDNKFELILPLIEIALDRLKNDLDIEEQPFFVERHIRLQYLLIKCKYELKHKDADKEWEILNRLILSSKLVDFDQYLNDLHKYRSNDLISITEIGDILEMHDQAMNEIVKVLFFCTEAMDFGEILEQKNFTGDTPYDVIYLDKYEGKIIVESIIGQQIHFPCLVYYFDGDIENVIYLEDNENNLEEVILTDLIYFAAYISYNKNKNIIDYDSLLRALGFVKLNEMARNIFSQVTDLDRLSKYDNSKEILNFAITIPKIPLTDTVDKMLFRLEEIFENSSIGTFR